MARRYLSPEHIEAGCRRILRSVLATDVRSARTVSRAGDVLLGKLRPYLNEVLLSDFAGVCSTDMLVFGRIQPIVLGGGKRFFPEGTRIDMTLAEASPLPTGVLFMCNWRAAA